ncbi:hypothetical protein AOQ84DRAFT_398180 [Glonium stellatum]|uniref:Oligopeptide transporter n=1 Tax=Glonium stellatum TaxID=574774 RepID=A0A8E2EZV6_9PEZI|nr:hypothetical protein AOQ84DRAFT_398180 [Glonium stellatum]
MILIAFSSGGIRAAITPLIAEQYKEMVSRIKIQRNGEITVTDRELTIQYIYNDGQHRRLSSTRNHTDGEIFKSPPSGSILPRVTRALWCGAKGGFRVDAAKPQAQFEKHHKEVPWDDVFIHELKSGLLACRILIFYPIHWLCLNQTFSNLIAQAGQMVNSGVPNDTIKSTNPITGIILIPLIQQGLYSFLRRRHIRFGPISRIDVGFTLASASIVYATGLQQLIYNTGPCYSHPRTCAASENGQVPNQVSMFLQAPIYMLGGLADVFCIPTGTEYAYNQAPRSMKSVVRALWLATAGVGACFAMAFTPVAKDPHLIVMYACLAVVMGVTTVAFWVTFRENDKEKMDML